MSESFYVTTPIYYVNARPHIGHAYTTIVADVLARRHRLLGEPTLFLTGTDEHGQKIERSAAAAGIAPKQFADEVSASFSSLWQRMGITNDQFIRTTSPEHARGVQKLFRTLYERGDIYLSSYTGQYSVSEEMFVEGPPGTIGPDGRPTETVTEENFFFRLSKYQLPLLNLIESGELMITPEARKNEVLSFLRGNVNGILEQKIAELSAEPSDDVSPAIEFETRREEVPAGRAFSVEAQYDLLTQGSLEQTVAKTLFVPGALKDLSVSRSSFTWGIPVPEDVQRDANATKPHVVYVWLDALANYITALGYGSDDTTRFDQFWPADVHLVGKEIIRFHCVYWPAFLLAADLQLPRAVTAHGWLLFDDSKMSKSRGNIVRTETILDAFGKLCPPQPNDALLADDLVARSGIEPFREPTAHERDLFASDVLRYFLLREIPFGQDGSFTFEALVTRYNADLANGYGNLVSRTLNLISQNFSVLPASTAPQTETAEEADDNLKKAGVWCSMVRKGFSYELTGHLYPIDDAWAANEFSGALAGIVGQIGRVDGFITVAKPWMLAKQDGEIDRAALESVLYTAAEAIRILTALLYPILPFTTANVWRQLGLGNIEEAAKRGELNKLEWGGLKPGTKLGALGPVFPRAEKGMAQTMSDMEQSKQTAQNPGQNVAATPASGTEAHGSSADAPVKSKLVDENFAAKPTPAESFDPAAPPRTASLDEANPGAQVAGSNATTTERPGTPSHADAGSGIFAAAQPAANETAAVSDGSPEITIDDFAKVELRVAKVLVCERIPKADKLLRLEVDLGYEQRQILSGIAEWYGPEDLLGKRIVVITNLAPRKMRGLVSHGMLLAASSEGGKPALATFADSDALPLGVRLK